MRSRSVLRRRRSHIGSAMEGLEARRLLAVISDDIHDDTLWTLAESPYEVTREIAVDTGSTLTIQPGVEVQFRSEGRLRVRGQLIAEGRPDARIEFEPQTPGSVWGGIKFDETRADNRISFADLDAGFGQGEAIDVDHSRLLLDNISWTRTNDNILELRHPSLIVRNSSFPTSSHEVIHGSDLSGDEYLVIQGNTFANSNNGSDVIDFLGADRPGPVLQILDNVFQGGGDDGLDLDGTDAHIEGNVFMNFRKNTGRNTTSNAIATGLPQTGAENRTEITVVRNLFVNNDHAILLKEDGFATIEHNVFVDSVEAAIQFHEVGGFAVRGAGRGADLRGNIFWNNQTLFKNLVDEPSFTTHLTIAQSLLPNEPIDFGGHDVLPHELGTGNIDGDPLFVAPAELDYRLQDGSPAIAAGLDGLNMGAYVPAGPRVTQIESNGEGIQLQVTGPGITDYRYQVEDGPLSPLTSVQIPIQLESDIGSQSVNVMGRNSAGEWYTGPTVTFGERHRDIIVPKRVRTGETLPMIARSLNWQHQTDTSYRAVEHLNAADGLSETGLLFQHGVASLAPTVNATNDVQLTSNLTVAVIDDEVPVREVSGFVSGDVTWTRDIEYRIVDDISIPTGSTLTIQPGTRVLVGERVNLFIRGTLRSLGSAVDPVLFTALDQAWGGLEFTDAGDENELRFTFFTRGGSDTSRTLGHSNSQPVIKSVRSLVTCDNCFVVDNIGKAFGASNGYVTIGNSVIANVDTGGEFISSVANITNTWLLSIPDDGRQFVDDDNDGFYFSGAHASGEPSVFRDSYLIQTKDDGLDHNGARLIVDGAWIEGAFHEGLATSNRRWATVHDSVFIGNNQGIEAGYGAPDVTVTQSVIVGNKNRVDPQSQVTAGIRFGDGYNGASGNYEGHISASHVVLHDNGDNVRNFDGTIPGPQAGAIDLTQSLVNDIDAEHTTQSEWYPGLLSHDAPNPRQRGL